MKIILNFPNYSVDENGNVFNTKRKKFKTQRVYHGYCYVQLFENGKTRQIQVHRLVAEAFIPNPENLPCINHKDENKKNNSVENLEWCTHKYNNEYGNSKPTFKAIQARKKAVYQYSLSGKLIAIYESSCEAQRKTGVHQTNISKCCLKRINFKTAGGFIWKYN